MRGTTMLPTIQGEFKIVAEPEIRFSDKGNAWAKLRCVAKDRVRDSNGNWTDGDSCFIDIIIGAGAEHIVESVTKGDGIIITGKLKQREYEYNGEKRVSYQINADSAGVSTRFGPARTKTVIEQANPVTAAQDTAGGTIIQPDEAPF